MNELELILTGQTSQHIHWLSDKLGIHHEMVSAYENMQAAAKAENIELKVASGFRDFSRQLTIWNNKFNSLNLSSKMQKVTQSICHF